MIAPPKSCGALVAVVVLALAGLVTAGRATAAPVVPADTVPRQWVAQRPGFAATTVVDPANHQVYVVGQGGGTDSRHFAVAAYSPAGRELWSDSFAVTPSGYDRVEAAAVDPVSHRLYVTGATSADDQGDVLTVAWSSAGVRLWSARWGGPAGSGTFDGAEAITVDPANQHVYVVGFGGTSNGRMVTLAYSAEGALLWSALYTGSPAGSAGARAVAVDPTTHAVVVGGDSSSSAADPYGYAVVSYTAAGERRWVARYDDPAGAESRVDAVAIDPDTHTSYVTGIVLGGTYRMLTQAYDASGSRLWSRQYGGTANTSGNVVLVDAGRGHVYTTGQTRSGGRGRSYLTVCYSTDGTVLWRRLYDGDATPGDSYPIAAALHPTTGAVYVTGATTTGSDYDIGTIAYGPAGERLWGARFGGIRDDGGVGVVVDPARGVYVAGQVATRWTLISY